MPGILLVAGMARSYTDNIIVVLNENRNNA
jgi:hypothetical protein